MISILATMKLYVLAWKKMIITYSIKDLIMIIIFVYQISLMMLHTYMHIIFHLTYIPMMKMKKYFLFMILTNLKI